MKQIYKKYPLGFGTICTLLLIIMNNLEYDFLGCIIRNNREITQMQYSYIEMIINYAEVFVIILVILKLHNWKIKKMSSWKMDKLTFVCFFSKIIYTILYVGTMFCYRWKKTLLVKDYIFVILYCIGVGLKEEMIFRGLILNSESRKKHICKISGRFKMVIASGICFGLCHFLCYFSDKTQQYSFDYYIVLGIRTFISGMLYAVIYMKTKNILLVILMHAIYDITPVVLQVQQAFGKKNDVLEKILGMSRGVILYIVMPILIILMCIFGKHDYEVKNKETEYC